MYSWKDDSEAVFGTIPVQWFIFAAVMYLPVVMALRMWMSRRNAFLLERPLVVWNAFMSVASGVCGYFVIRDLLVPLVRGSDKLCDLSVFAHPSMRFILLFNFSKALEWVDTLFLVLRKKPLGFLHLFHHVTTMLYCLHATYFDSFNSDAGGVYFCSMNLVVHTIMYGYWALVPSFGALRSFGFVVTLMQTAQMVVGVLIVIGVVAFCPLSWERNWHGHCFAFAMYAVYLVLFARLVFEKIPSSKKQNKKVN